MKVNEQKKLETYRFKIVKGEKQQDGKIEKSYQAGVAILLEGQPNYSLHLYMLQNEEFFLVPHKKDPERYFIMTRQPTKNPYKRAKYSWNIVGLAKTNCRQGCIELYFDLFNVPLYMSIFPQGNSIAHELKLAA
ncbi:MAG: hypothetical protein Q7U04_15300 [Bacteriovorax sp.]|nr:hypothetical protein [Bacteriovorax sp.]